MPDADANGGVKLSLRHYRPIAKVVSAALTVATPRARLTNGALQNWLPALAATAPAELLQEEHFEEY